MSGIGLSKTATIWQLLEQRLKASPYQTFLIEAVSLRELTVAEFYDLVINMAKALYAQGIDHQSVVCWQAPTAIDTAVLMFALARLGVTQAPIIHLYREREIAEIVSQSQPSHFIILDDSLDKKRLRMVEDALHKVTEASPQLVDFERCKTSGAEFASLPQYDSNCHNVHWYYFTSGTTARPKGAKHSDSSLLAGAQYLGQSLEVTSHDVGTIGYPMAHIGGVIYCAMALLFGIPVVLLAHYTAELVVSSFRRFGVTLGGGSTAHYQLLLDEQRKTPELPLVPSLRLLSGGGAAKPADLYWQVKEELGVKIIHAYGMTEAPITSSNSPHDSDEQLMYRDGIPMPSIEVKIVDSTGDLVKQGQSGEIWLRGPNLCQGYLIAEQTLDAFDEQGFYHTGDIGVMHDDEHIAITGRIKDIIIRKGENISAREIEELLAKHKAVKEVAVIGLADVERGELVCAVLELKDATKPLSFEEMKQFLLSAKLMPQKIPERLEIIDSLPRSESLQKVQKNLLRERFQS